MFLAKNTSIRSWCLVTIVYEWYTSTTSFGWTTHSRPSTRHGITTMLDYLKTITLKSVIGDWTSANDDFVRHISDRGREVSLIPWYQNSFDSAQHVKWWVVCDSRSKPIDSLVLHIIHLKFFILTKDANGNEYIRCFLQMSGVVPH